MLNAALGFVPDLAVAWAASKITDSDWQGFFVTLLVLQCIYFFFWAKTALWAWLLFWIYGKGQLADHFARYFADAKFPAPSAYAKDLDDYLGEMTGNERLDCSTRMKAAFEAGTLGGFKAARRFSLALQINSAAAVAMRRHARVAQPAPQKDEASLIRQSGIVAVAMSHDDLMTIAWLADYGFRVWIEPGENQFRRGERFAQGRAELLADLLDHFDRKIVPNLLADTEQDKERRFVSHENRMKSIWDCYPDTTGPWDK